MLGIVVVPALPILTGFIGAWFASANVKFIAYVVEVVQDGQLFFYSVATGCGQGIEAWEWHGHGLYTPYRGIIALLAVIVVAASIFFYGMIAALRQTNGGTAGQQSSGGQVSAGAQRKGAVACFSIAFALGSAILITCSHIWIRAHGG
jgi:hypothetical protein